MTNIDGIDYKVTSKSEFEQIKKSIKTNQIKDSEKSLFIEELEKIKEEIKDLDLGFFDEDYRAGIARGIMEFNKILNKHISELKGERTNENPTI